MVQALIMQTKIVFIPSIQFQICSMNLTCRYCGNPEFTAVYHSTKIMDGAGDCKTFHKSDNEYIFNISLASSRAVATMPQTTAGLRTSNKSTACKLIPLLHLVQWKYPTEVQCNLMVWLAHFLCAARTKPLSSLTFVSRAIETTALATHLTGEFDTCSQVQWIIQIKSGVNGRNCFR